MPASEVYQARAFARNPRANEFSQLGHPVHPKFEVVCVSKAELRKRPGFPRRNRALLMAGGEGGGKLLPTTLALARKICAWPFLSSSRGRNAALRQKLGELAPAFATPMTILGYCNKVPS